MKQDRTITTNYKLCVVITILFLFILNSVYSQKFSIITGLALNGKSATSVNMNIFPAGKGGNKTVANINDQLQAGTRIVIPAGVIVRLQSPGGTQVIKSTEGKPIEYTVDFTAQGENHVVKGFGAQIENTVKKQWVIITGIQMKKVQQLPVKEQYLHSLIFLKEKMKKLLLQQKKAPLILLIKFPALLMENL